jgi:hypothetical protein
VTLEIDIPACVVDVTSRVICALLYDVCRHRIIAVRSCHAAVGVSISHRRSISSSIECKHVRKHRPFCRCKHDATSAGRAAADPAADGGGVGRLIIQQLHALRTALLSILCKYQNNASFFFFDLQEGKQRYCSLAR